MFMRTFFALVSCLAGGFAFSQTAVLSDAQKRKLHVPYVRATTDCVAAFVSDHSQFQNAVANSSFAQLIKDALLGHCMDAGQRMVAAHDAIYGGGGMAFLTGPYLSDVERAVRVRLATKIVAAQEAIARAAEARRIELERLAAKRAEEVAISEQVTATIRTRTYACVRKEAGSMIMAAEKAEVIAKAAAVFCRTEIEALAEAVRQGAKLRGESANFDLDAMAKERVTEIVTAEIIKIRAELAKSATERKKESEPTF